MYSKEMSDKVLNDVQDYKCPGCQRKDIHKMCPAHDTVFYMSGFEFTKEIEDCINQTKEGSPDMDLCLLNILKAYTN